MFIHYTYFYMLFPLREAIPIMFEGIIIHDQILQTWIGHNATCYMQHVTKRIVVHIHAV